jgi:hypothetical protein
MARGERNMAALVQRHYQRKPGGETMVIAVGGPIRSSRAQPGNRRETATTARSRMGVQQQHVPEWARKPLTARQAIDTNRGKS